MEQTVHVRVTDSATGKLLPCRLHLRDAFGRERVPLGYFADPATEPGREVGGHLVHQDRVWAYTDGSCEVRLPPGRVVVEAWHGPFYAPVTQETDRGLGRIAIRVRLNRAIPQPNGWYWADTRAHFLSPAAAALEGAAEGLDLVHLLAGRWPPSGLPRISNLFDFSGQSLLLERHGCGVCVNTYQRGGPWGDLALLHCHRIVFPLTVPEPGFEQYTLADWCYQCHRKGGLVVWPAFPGTLGERLPLAWLGEIDAVEWCFESPWNAEALQLWYALLNAGRRLALVGASGKSSNTVPLGAVRTAAWLGSEQPFTLAHWVHAVKQGQTYATRGPILHWQINGQPYPWTLSPSAAAPSTPAVADAATVSPWHIVAQARSVTPFRVLELLCGGEVLASANALATTSPDASATPTHKLYFAELSWQLTASELERLPGAWLALRCWDETGLAAHTSPIYLPRRPRLRDADRRHLDQALAESESTLTSTAHPRQAERLQQLLTIRTSLSP